jgi:YHS domain-containing protein
MPSARDPICGMPLKEEQIVATFVYLGEEYAFCCVECYDMFVRTPERVVVHLAHAPEGHYSHLCAVQRADQIQSIRPQ